MRKVILCAIFVFFVASAAALAQSPEEFYRKGNLSYENEDYEKAISLYEELLKMDKASPEIFYNLGNSYFKLRKIGKAILNYERALRLLPRDRDAKLNLKLARSMAIDKIELPEKGFILSVLLIPYENMSINELTAFVSIFYLAVITLFIFSIFFVEKRKNIFYTASATGFFLTVFTIFLVSKIHNECFVKQAVIISDKVDVRSGPKEDYLLQFTLHEGVEVRVVEERESWYEIDLSKDLKGWIPKETVGVI